MNKKQNKLLNDNKLREIKVSDSLTNLEEFTRIMTDDIDFNCFDVLSVTRIDADQPYTKKFAHRHVDTQVYRIASDEDETLPLGIAKNKLN
ncbi:hypothetical protein [Kaarinaea lacus]